MSNDKRLGIPEEAAFQNQVDYYLRMVGAFVERVMVFIDAGYVQACVRDRYAEGRLDVRRFADKLTANRRLVRTYLYTGKIERPPNDHWQQRQQGQQKMLAALAQEPLVEVRLGRLRFGDDGVPRQKGVDVPLALDMLRFALKGNYDTAILVSGDGDFADIVRMVKDEGRKVELVTFPDSRSWALLEACDIAVQVTPELLDGCWLDQGELIA